MRILLTCAYYYPEKVAMTPLLRDLAQACAQAGHHVTVITPTPCRGVDSETRIKYKKIKKETSSDGNLTIIRFPLYPESTSVKARFARYLICNLQHLRFALFMRYDLLFEYSTPPTQGIVGAMVKMFRRKPVVYNVQDIFPDSMVSTGLTHRDSMAWKIGRLTEKIAYWGASRIIVISDSMKANLLSKGVKEEKLSRIYNWVDINAIHPVMKGDNPLFDEFGLNREDFHIVYAGNLGMAQNLDIFLDSAKEFETDKRVKFLIIGNGEQEAHLKERISQERLGNVRIYPMQPVERVSEVYSLGDLCLVSCKKGFGGIAMPSKMWTILGAGRPVIASFDPESDVEQIITSERLGYFATAENLHQLTQAIHEALNHPEQLKEMGSRGRQFIESHISKEQSTSQYIKFFETLCNL